MAEPILEVRGLAKHFGGIHAVADCSFAVEPGSITALIGPNGAGKTTAFNCISGTLRPTSGEIRLNGRRIDGLRPHRIARMGLGRTFQISRNLEDLTVLENLVVQAQVQGLLGLFRPAISAAEQAKAERLLEFLNIARLAHEPTRNLSYGQKKLMDLAALLMADPSIILLDEPAGGVNPRLLEDIIGHLQALNAQGLTVLIVEHNMDLVMRISHRVIVMAYGEILRIGTPAEVQGDPQVLKAYLGGKAAEPDHVAA
jgi:branched-chain amino acid transport system ATP-binding protein